MFDGNCFTTNHAALAAQKNIYIYSHVYQLSSLTLLITTMVRFVDYASLSATAPANHPRLIDITTYSISEEDHDYCNGYASTFNMWDAVVTLLHTISPATLDSFLDDSANEFKVILSWTGQPNKLLIWRKGTEILVREPATP